MSTKTISELLMREESEDLEFCSSRSRIETIAKHVCAFLNSSGGELLVGVGANREIEGIGKDQDSASWLELGLARAISPLSLWAVEKLEEEGKEVYLISVPEGLDKPYVANGAIYTRMGVSTRPADRDVISQLISESVKADNRWERSLAWGAELEDLDQSLVATTINLAKDARRWDGDVEDPSSFLNDMGLLQNGLLTNAALVVFGLNPTKFLPQLRVRLLGFPEGKTSNQYSFDRLFEKNLLHTATELQEELTAYLGSSHFRDSDWQRQDGAGYPMSALREGIMNALVHRNYELSGTITISLSPDFVQISNPGGLPSELKVGDLKREHPSVPVNPDIAHICFLNGLIEKVGRGTQRILEDCKNAKLRVPQWKSSNLETVLTLYSKNPTSKTKGLNDRQTEILKMLAVAGAAVTVAMLLKNFGVTDRTIRNDLRELVDQDQVKKVGDGPSTTYTSADRK